MHIQRLIDFIAQDEDQKNCLQLLADKRSGDLNMYIQSGIVYIPPLEQTDEWAYISEQLGVTKEELGVTDTNYHLLDDGYMLPILDSEGEILFYINHNFERAKELKYINGYIKDDVLGNMKMYGLHNTLKGLTWGKIYVCEGFFDARRLEYAGYPVVAPLGTKIMPFHINYFKRFEQVVYIRDNDTAGELAFKKFKETIPNTVGATTPYGYKDMDELGGKNPSLFEQWITTLP